MTLLKTIIDSYVSTKLKSLSLFATLVLTAGFTPQVGALPAAHYADCSVLSSGRWVKIAVSERGVYRIDAATLQAWGFADASTVCVYGKDGYMLPETFSSDDTDDLEQIPSYVDGDDLYFMHLVRCNGSMMHYIHGVIPTTITPMCHIIFLRPMPLPCAWKLS